MIEVQKKYLYDKGYISYSDSKNEDIDEGDN